MLVLAILPVLLSIAALFVLEDASAVLVPAAVAGGDEAGEASRDVAVLLLFDFFAMIAYWISACLLLWSMVASQVVIVDLHSAVHQLHLG